MDNSKGIRRGFHENILKHKKKTAFIIFFLLDFAADRLPTIILHEAIDLREIANTYLGQNGIIVWQASTRIENLCEQAIRVTIRIGIIVEKSANIDLISHIK